MASRKENALKTREKIIDAVKQLLQEKDFDSTTVFDITTVARVAKGTFYIYFKRKEDVLYELGLRSFNALSNEICTMDGSIFDKLVYYFRNFMKRVEAYGINVCRGWIGDVIKSENVKNNKWESDQKNLKLFFEKSIEENVLKPETPVNTLAYILISELYGMAIGWCMSAGKFEPLYWVDEFCKTQLKSLLTPYLKK
jgi:AcrR family transcriptional regulator